MRTFNGKVLVDIREYYEDGGERKPGRKGIIGRKIELKLQLSEFYLVGISLSLEQWEALKDSFAEIDSKIEALQS